MQTFPIEDESPREGVVAVFGSGSFGTALGTLVARNGYEVRILTRRAEVAESINKQHRNPTHMSEFELPHNLKAYMSPEECLEGAKFIIHCIPVQSSTQFLKDVAHLIPADVPIISASKGICSDSLEMMHEIIPTALGHTSQPMAFLSGPTFARELLSAFPSGCVMASTSDNTAERCARLFSSHTMRVYRCRDVIGVEVGGALKNVFALAAGITDGLGWGLNTTALLVTLGCREINQVAVAMGAEPATLSGLAGIGDLMLTCFGSESRNRSFGRRLGQGASVETILEERGASLAGVAEGVATAPAALRLAQKHGVSVPLITGICNILEGKLSPEKSMASLLEYPVKIGGDVIVSSA